MSENITIRKKTAIPTNSFDCTESFQNRSLSSTHTELARSLPDLSTLNSSELNEHKNTIKSLESELECAHNEIEKLNLENLELKKKLSERDLKIKELTHICSSSAYKESLSLRKKALSSIKKKLNFCSNHETPVNKGRSLNVTSTPFLQTGTQNTLNQETQTNHSVIEVPKLTNSSSSPVKNHDIHQKNRIWIFGGQQVSGIGVLLSDMRELTKYEQYTVSCLSKPYAASSEILKGCTNIMQMKKGDKIVISIGENDTNPLQTVCELYNTLKLITDYDVLILSIIENRFLNVNLINNEIKLVCEQFSNCKFLDLRNKKVFYTQPAFQSMICQRINFMIDCMDYDYKFLNFNKKKTKSNMFSASENSTCIDNSSKCRKGTIPYYFKRVDKKKCFSNQCLDTSANKPDMIYKKGTIPFYFAKTFKEKNRSQSIDSKNSDNDTASKQFFL